MEVRVGGWRGGGVLGWGGGGMRGVLISPPWTQRDLGYDVLPMIYLASSFISQSWTLLLDESLIVHLLNGIFTNIHLLHGMCVSSNES